MFLGNTECQREGNSVEGIIDTDRELERERVPVTSNAENTRSGDDYLELFWEKGHGSRIGYENSIASADVDNDGIDEIIFGNQEGFVHVIQYSDGEYIDEWKSPNLGSQTFGLTTGDVDNDGIIEIIVGTYYYLLYIFGYENEETGFVQEWSYTFAETSVYGLATGDTDNDGISEIIVGTSGFSDSEANVYVFEFDGSTYVLEWSALVGDYSLTHAHTITIGDVDDDGINEFIVGTREYKALGSSQGAFYIFGYNGVTYILEWKKDETTTGISDIGIGDVDDDGVKEIVVGGNNVTIYQHQLGMYIVDGIIEENEAIVEVGDVNNDSKLEIVTGTDKIKVWADEALRWESENFAPKEVFGIVIEDSDDDIINEIIVSVGETAGDSDLVVLGFDGIFYQKEWKGDYLADIEALSLYDVGDDIDNRLLLGTGSGNILVYGFQDGDYLIENSIAVSEEDQIWFLFTGNFDDDPKIEIVAISTEFTGINYNTEISFIEHVNENYVISHRLVIEDGVTMAADVGDVDNDGIEELVIGTWTGYVDVIGFNGDSYVVEWQDQFSNLLVEGVGVGDSDGDGISEIVIGTSYVGGEDTLYVIGFDGEDYAIEWSTYVTNGVSAADVGDSDNDGGSEIVVVGIYNSTLIIFGWDGNTYSEEWSSGDPELFYDECLDICNIDSNGENKLVIGEDDLFVLSFEDTYEYIWQTESLSCGIECIFVGDTDS
ncbi:MAG: VCBS repeat-containing protein, partial [Thermoplasmata archaeon]